jgi:hypothetical protein
MAAPSIGNTLFQSVTATQTVTISFDNNGNCVVALIHVWSSGDMDVGPKYAGLPMHVYKTEWGSGSPYGEMYIAVLLNAPTGINDLTFTYIKSDDFRVQIFALQGVDWFGNSVEAVGSSASAASAAIQTLSADSLVIFGVGIESSSDPSVVPDADCIQDDEGVMGMWAWVGHRFGTGGSDNIGVSWSGTYNWGLRGVEFRAPPGGPIPQYDADTFGYGEAESHSLTHVASGTNRYAIGIIYARTPITSPAVTYGGQAMTLLGAAKISASHEVYYFGLINPPTGSQSVAFSWTNIVRYVVAVVTFTGVHQGDPVGTIVTNTGNGLSISDNVDCEQYGLAFDSIGSLSGQTPGESQGLLDHFTAGYMGARSSFKRAWVAGAVTMSWEQGSIQDWVHVAVPLRPARAGGVHVIWW